MICHVHSVRCHHPCWPSSPTQCQTSGPGRWPEVVCPSHALKDTSNQEGLVTLIPSHLLQYCSISVIKTCLHDQQSDYGLKSDRSSASTSSSVSSLSEGLGGFRHPHHGQWPHREPEGHMTINLPVFNDEDTKDAVT